MTALIDVYLDLVVVIVDHLEVEGQVGVVQHAAAARVAAAPLVVTPEVVPKYFQGLVPNIFWLHSKIFFSCVPLLDGVAELVLDLLHLVPDVLDLDLQTLLVLLPPQPTLHRVPAH